jgi:hypothetical protein
VGTGLGCGYTTIQDAVDAAAAYEGEKYVTIATNQSYTAQSITISDQNLHLLGGIGDCNSFSPSGTTTISGAGASVLTILGTSNVTLSSLEITGGSTAGSGGGIYFLAATDR